MKNHIKIYKKYFNIGDQDMVFCEVCRSIAVDIHHITYRSQGGQNNIENLIALCRNCHNRAHFKQEPYLKSNALQDYHNQRTASFG